MDDIVLSSDQKFEHMNQKEKQFLKIIYVRILTEQNTYQSDDHIRQCIVWLKIEPIVLK